MLWQLHIVFVTFVTFHQVSYGKINLIAEPILMRLETMNNFDHVRQDCLQSESVCLSTCQLYADWYAVKAAEFANCSIGNASPFRVCEECVVPYMEADAIYNEIDKMDQSNCICKTILLESNKIQILKTFNDFIKKIWSSSYCRKCFSNISVANHTVDYTYSGDTIRIQQLYRNITDCIMTMFNVSQQNATETCAACQSKYQELMIKYKDIAGDWKNADICMDLVDMMNSTRLYWGGTLKCTKGHKIYFKEFVLAVILIVCPVVFYAGFGIYGTKIGQKQMMIQKRLFLHKQNYDSLDRNAHVNSSSSEILPQQLTARPHGSASLSDSMDQNNYS